MSELARTILVSPIGKIEITADGDCICGIDFVKGKTRTAALTRNPVLDDCAKQLREYFAGKRRIFELKLKLQGTEFQTRVWRALLDVGFGETASYGDIAAEIGRPGAVRAVGGANGSNPIGIVVPCHRIIGGSGALVGYGGGLWRKKWLLDHERMSAAKKTGGGASGPRAKSVRGTRRTTP